LHFSKSEHIVKNIYRDICMIRSECVLKVGVIGINHKTANLAFREAIARGAATLSGEKALFFSHPVLLLSTCNRTEIYFGGDDLATIHSDLLEWLRGHVREAFEHRLYSYFGIDCFIHLARVAAGLDSAILAETEIQRQVKIAYGLACKFSKLPSCMHYIFQKALKIGKLVRSQISMDRAPSLFQAIWQLAGQHLEQMGGPRILLVGHSEINRRMAHFLLQRKITQITLITQHPSLVALDGCISFGYEEIDRWSEYDWIICASNHDRFLIQPQSCAHHVIFDLSVPRNVDPKVGELEGVFLYNIEQINDWIQQTKSKYTEQIALSNALIGGETVRLAKIYRQKTMQVEALR
jgi:glutamyl-tRNA reductase